MYDTLFYQINQPHKLQIKGLVIVITRLESFHGLRKANLVDVVNRHVVFRDVFAFRYNSHATPVDLVSRSGALAFHFALAINAQHGMKKRIQASEWNLVIAPFALAEGTIFNLLEGVVNASKVAVFCLDHLRVNNVNGRVQSGVSHIASAVILVFVQRLLVMAERLSQLVTLQEKLPVNGSNRNFLAHDYSPQIVRG